MSEEKKLKLIVFVVPITDILQVLKSNFIRPRLGAMNRKADILGDLPLLFVISTKKMFFTD